MTAQILLVFEIWRFLYFSHNFKKKNLDVKKTWMQKTGTSFSQFVFSFVFSKKLDVKKLTELQFLNPIVGCFQGTFRGCKYGVQV